MSIYRDTIYPYLVHKLGDPPPIRAVRQQLIPLAQGRVLEIGAGSGPNFPYYSKEGVSKLFALEPNRGMIRLAKARQPALTIEFIDLPGERIHLEDETIDTAVSTFTLCTIPGILEAIREITRVLRWGGRFLFFELGRSPDIEVQKQQRQLEPICHRLFQGLHLTRDIPSLIVQGGLQIGQMESGYLAEFPKPFTFCWWGTAVKEHYSV